MKTSVNWLKEYIDIKNPQKIAENLTMSIAEVEDIEDLAQEKFRSIVIGKILEVTEHPNADKLKLAKVNIGEKTLKIICGAPNLEQGQKVPVALINAQLPCGLIIKKVNIRGQESEGMICSEKELGLAKKSDGIMVLAPDSKINEPFSKYQNIDDTVFDIDNKSLTHRPDLFSHIGIAREIAAIENKKLQLPKNIKVKSNAKKIKVEIKDKKLCPRYIAVQLENIKIQGSPKWMQARLSAVGMRSINNIIDITNYVMLEWGQPLHAFDADKINEKIIIRRAKQEETIKTIDQKKRKLDSEMLIIADQKNPIAVAGVMGGTDSEVSKNTTSIVLESANFNACSIRQTARKLGLHSEASMRFEKNLSRTLPEVALHRAIQLFQEICQAKIASKITNIYPAKQKTIKIKLDPQKVEQFLGEKISRTKIKSILKSLDFKITGAKILTVEVPWFRMDIHIEEDLFEEIARIYGYDNIKPQALTQQSKPTSSLPDLELEKQTRDIFKGFDFSEMINYSFISKRLLQQCNLNPEEHLKVLNPQSKDLQYLRASLFPNLINNAKFNLKRFSKINIFEIGHIYQRPNNEFKSLAGLISGRKEKIFYNIKGIIESFLNQLNINYQIEPLEQKSEYFAKNKTIQIKSNNKIIGRLGLIDQRILDKINIKKNKIAYFDLSIEQLVNNKKPEKKYQPISKFPPITLDIAFVLDKTIQAINLEKEILQTGKPLLKKIKLFDVYIGKPLALNERNLAYHLIYQDPNKTLMDQEVQQIQKKIINHITQKFNARIRKF